MPLAAGERLGPYEILALIGAGGMGEVYRARDTRLDRVVAVKVCKEKFSERFEREARAVAALNHPHICHLYDVGPNYLVMEYIEGTGLKGPLPLDKALEYGAQICDALDAAHSKGIAHRDLKPANILVTKSRGVKLLDFGLAKQTHDRQGADDETLTMALTGEGQIVGTLYYMSPEQVQGQDAGPESDIFSFGLVLYEALTGKRAFEGKSSASVIAAILERPAPSVADVAPAALDRVLSKCLEKDPERRWQSARDLRTELEWIASAPVVPEKTAPSQSRLVRSAPWGVAALVALGLGYPTYRHATEEAPRMVKMSVLPPEGAALSPRGGPAVSPDGKSIAFVAAVDGKNQIWVRDLDSLAARPLPGTEGNAVLPFWSPDSRSIAFFTAGKLKRVEVAGGPALPICDITNIRGGSWGKDYIVFGSTTGIFRVPPAGGDPTPVTAVAPDLESSHAYPWFLPDGRHFLYASVGADVGQSVVYAADVESKNPSKKQHKLLVGPYGIAYAQGYLLFIRDRTLMAQLFDTESLETRGEAAPVAEQVDSFIGATGIGVSQNGVLAYTSGAVGNTQLTWYGHSGKPVGKVGMPGLGFSAAISPDGPRSSSIAETRTAAACGCWTLREAASPDSPSAPQAKARIIPSGRMMAVRSRIPHAGRGTATFM